MLSPDKTTESSPDILVVMYRNPGLPCLSCDPVRRQASQLQCCCWLCHCKQPNCNKQIWHSAEAVFSHATAGMPNTATDCWVSGLGRALQFLDVMLAVSAASRYSKNISHLAVKEPLSGHHCVYKASLRCGCSRKSEQVRRCELLRADALRRCHACVVRNGQPRCNQILLTSMHSMALVPRCTARARPLLVSTVQLQPSCTAACQTATLARIPLMILEEVVHNSLAPG